MRSWWCTSAAADAWRWTELCDSCRHWEVSGDSVVTVDKLAADHEGDTEAEMNCADKPLTVFQSEEQQLRFLSAPLPVWRDFIDRRNYFHSRSNQTNKQRSKVSWFADQITCNLLNKNRYLAYEQLLQVTVLQGFLSFVIQDHLVARKHPNRFLTLFITLLL